MHSGLTFSELRKLESSAGRNYWQTWARVPVTFESDWQRAIPDHWRLAGPRTSAAEEKKRARKATTPVHAILNYTYAILETEATIAAHKLGFDPSLGLMHVDQRYRSSLAADLMEPVRPGCRRSDPRPDRTARVTPGRHRGDARRRLPRRYAFGAGTRTVRAEPSSRGCTIHRTARPHSPSLTQSRHATDENAAPPSDRGIEAFSSTNRIESTSGPGQRRGCSLGSRWQLICPRIGVASVLGLVTQSQPKSQTWLSSPDGFSRPFVSRGGRASDGGVHGQRCP